MDIKKTFKSYLEHLKSKWFVYFAVIFALIILWFVLCYGQATKVPKNLTLSVWVTPYSQGTEQEYVDVENILNELNNNYKNYGYKKFQEKTNYVNKNNNEQKNTFTWYADNNVDLFIMPLECFKNDVKEDFSSDYDVITKSNSLYCNRFIDLNELFLQGSQESIDFYNGLSSSGKLISFTGLDNDLNYLEPRIVGIKINDEYGLAISKYHTTQNDTLISLISSILDLT